MAKIIRVKTCGDCCPYVDIEDDGLYWCQHRDGPKYVKPEEIHPNCPLLDAPEEK
jgi:hypothetical protein